MGILEGIATLFINTFGITQPTDATRRRAAWFILALLLLTICVVVVVGFALNHGMRR